MKKKLLILFFAGLQLVCSAQNELDIIRLTTTQPIVDEPKTNINVQIIQTNGTVSTSDDKVILQSKAGIELRGSSSQLFPKKPYGLEIRNEDGSDKDVSLFGWPADSDYVLFTSYNEKSLIHNVLAMNLGTKLGLIASRTRYVNLFLNNEYRGIYVLMEKLKRGQGRVDISKLAEKDTVGEGLTGGYIVKMDKTTGQNIGGWSSKYPFNRNGFSYPFYQYEYPDSMHVKQKKYIKDYYDAFEKELANRNYNPTTGYQKYIDVNSFVNLMLLNEITFNVDGYRISTYFHKDKNEKMKAGPAWDYDLSFGNADYCQGWTTENFSYNFNQTCPGDGFQIPFIWKELLNDTTFLMALKRRYTKERKDGFLKESNWNATIDSFANQIAPTVGRNFTRWPILGVYVWPNPQPVPTTWEGEVAELKSWLRRRLNFLDFVWTLPTTVDPVQTTDQKLVVAPNTITSDEINILLPKAYQEVKLILEVYNMSGQLVTKEENKSTGKEIKSNMTASLNQGLYLLKVKKGDDYQIAKFIKM
jgi:hypothetical protein